MGSGTRSRWDGLTVLASKCGHLCSGSRYRDLQEDLTSILLSIIRTED